MAKLTKEDILSFLKDSTLLEISDLIKTIEKEFGVSAAAPVAAAAPTSVSVILVDAGANKIAIIKLFKEATGLGLMEAKTAVEKGNAVIKTNVKPDEAEAIKKTYEEQGAQIKIE
jgi:large subunit ribosomal protein L7/L12